MNKLMGAVLLGLTFLAAEANSKIIEFKSGASGFDTRTFFYVGSKDVVAIDSQFTAELAEESIRHLRKFTDKPISTLIITHPNPDKFNGASVFKKLGASIVASKATSEAMSGVHEYKKYYFTKIAKMFTEESYPKLTTIDKTFDQKMLLKLKGSETLLLKELKNPGVSSNQTVLLVESENALFVGDLIHHKAHAWLEGGIVLGKATPTIDGWILDLEELEKIFKSNPNVFPGRGLTVSLKIAVSEQKKYLKRSVEIIKALIAKHGLSKKDLGGEKEVKFNEDLSAEFSKAFPDYQLLYMIQYGAYGLVGSLLE